MENKIVEINVAALRLALDNALAQVEQLRLELEQVRKENAIYAAVYRMSRV